MVGFVLRRGFFVLPREYQMGWSAKILIIRWWVNLTRNNTVCFLRCPPDSRKMQLLKFESYNNYTIILKKNKETSFFNIIWILILEINTSFFGYSSQNEENLYTIIFLRQFSKFEHHTVLIIRYGPYEQKSSKARPSA